MRGRFASRRMVVLVTLGFSSAVSLGLLAVNVIHNHSLADTYLGWNLLLAWLPLILSVWLIAILPRYPWLSWRPLVLTVLWLGLLPNSFYLISDLVHLPEVASQNLLYDSVMFESFILNGLMLGYLSLYLVHRQLLRRTGQEYAAGLIGFTLALCSFAIYVGRDLRWSSWDLLSNPAGILFNVTNPIIDPRQHMNAYTTTLTFAILLGALYIVIWRLSHVFARRPSETKL